MPLGLETLTAQARRLPPADRARLLDCLIASLELDAGIEAAWDDLADQREQERRTGSADCLSFEVVVARLETRFPG